VFQRETGGADEAEEEESEQFLFRRSRSVCVSVIIGGEIFQYNCSLSVSLNEIAPHWFTWTAIHRLIGSKFIQISAIRSIKISSILLDLQFTQL
jgi:hypothetical protein